MFIGRWVPPRTTPFPSRFIKYKSPSSPSPPFSFTSRSSKPIMDPLMDVEDEWEILSDDGFLEISDGGGKQIYSRNSAFAAAAILHANYFICPSPSPPLFLPTAAAGDQPIQINTDSFRKDEGGADQDPISQVFFKKQAEFADIRVESPKPAKFEPSFQFEDPGEFDADMAIQGEEKDDGDDDDVWKWRLNGIGAICSFGVAAATLCIIVFTNSHSHKLQFRIYADDKRRMKVKGAIAAVSGVPINRARITVGGYYDPSSASAAAAI